MRIAKTNVPGYVKDTKTGQVTNTNQAAFEEFKMTRTKAKEFESMKEDIKALRSRIEMLESLVKVLSVPKPAFTPEVYWPYSNTGNTEPKNYTITYDGISAGNLNLLNEEASDSGC